MAVEKRDVLSANILHSEVTPGKLSIYIRNNNGLKTDPCITLAEMFSLTFANLKQPVAVNLLNHFEQL